MDMFVMAETSVWLEKLTFAWNIAQMAIGLGVVIFVHELGHFLAAKSCGVKCEKFYLGFDVPMPKIGPFQIPSKLVHFQYGETEYGIGIVPLGGYVKMLGQDDNPANAQKEAERTRVKKDEDAAESKTETSGREETGHHKTVHDANLEPQPLRENVDYQLDPRSYTAKSVPQRMLIISAGVIMNVIFAVVFATIAYGVGVPYTPAIIGSVSPGSPAWEMDLPRGAQVLRVGDKGEPRQHLRFLQDMAQSIVLHGFQSDLSLLIRAPGSDKPYEVTIRPVGKERGNLLGKMASIGVGSAVEPVLADKDPLIPGFPAAEAKVAMQPGDRIVAGIYDGKVTQIENYWDLQTFLARYVDDTITLRVERKVSAGEKNEKTEQLDVVLAPRRLRRMGLVMTMGPVTAIQDRSPAQDAQPVDDPKAEKGFQKGDMLQAINGEPIKDPMTAPDIIRRLAGQEVIITVQRPTSAGKSEQVELKVTPREVSDYQSGGGGDEPVLVDALGLTYAVEPTVTAVDPRCTAKDKFQPGDKITKFQVIPAGATEEQRRQNKEILEKAHVLLKEIDLTSGQFTWTLPFFLVQSLPDAAVVKLTYQRGSEDLTAELRPYASDKFNFAVRGMILKPLQETYTAQSWGEAAALGLRETKESLMLVVTFLKKLVSRQISPTALGGPGTIAAVATSEASRGIGALLIFLTMLSANLAVVNFLPIPVLDGGHMMFLLWEGIFRRPVPEAWQIRLTLIGFGFILCLMAFVIGLDIYRLGGFGS